MIDNAEMKRIWGRKFKDDKDDPAAWGFTATNLRRAAEVLFEAYRASRLFDEDEEPPALENQYLNSPATLLYGCAMENALKGYLIKKCGGYEKAATRYKSIWRGHKLIAFATETGIKMTGEQKLVLGSLEAFVIWAGRYPVSLHQEKFTIAKQLRSGDHMIPEEISQQSLDVMNPFFEAIMKALSSHLLAALQESDS